MAATRLHEFYSAVQGFQSIWTPVVGEELPCKREAGNSHDSFAVAVVKDHVVVGLLPRKLSAIFWSFLRNGSITCIITGIRRYSRDLVQGGVEIPCTLIFKGEPSRIEKVKGLLKECKSKTDNSKKDRSTANSRAESKDSVKEDRPGTGNETINKVNHVEIISDQQEFNGPSKRQRIAESEWVCLARRMSLQVKEKDVIIQGEQLTDEHINASQKLLKEQFTWLEGLCTTLKVTICSYTTWIPNYLQIFQTRGNHWVTITTIGCTKMTLWFLTLCMMTLTMTQKAL